MQYTPPGFIRELHLKAEDLGVPLREGQIVAWPPFLPLVPWRGATSSALLRAPASHAASVRRQAPRGLRRARAPPIAHWLNTRPRICGCCINIVRITMTDGCGAVSKTSERKIMLLRATGSEVLEEPGMTPIDRAEARARKGGESDQGRRVIRGEEMRGEEKIEMK
jgi:hypothetical protein